ncbi:TauD/TfdA family dioxygenase [Xenorhabdus bovienii]|uniref:TauD/TfdA family dioxygenase n=1 Tax=Xenorhabdus bovienii TaxID=40576 RepID=A0AAJ1MZ17_XENBV|nr:TauD/TfdA family dioxygenase [Xenorhabdus bovienii]MDE1476712.1 TauD/TfdA family dioxygenase [Xenorhabdus bovienii]MDE1485895.1 TauD/TfdA family dioxygenase [Xenorhabdus bovienii]MDE1489313.1 TauD/TfdA family dioxygenase [Xenorhabdus bovienii]MDE1494650.1 TauD/TfdA family dioxygenase [Xenorhabdus bovienii]MDE9435523.1 TauD/TfdA family dioxygenase [Xenorhabdus bovienii]
MSDKNKYTIRKLSPYFCAEIRGIDLNGPLDDELVKSIRSDLEAHEVLVFPEQDLTSEDLMRLGRYFGPLTVHPFAENSEKNPELIVFDYKDGNPPVLTDRWHSDETYKLCPPMATMLYSRIVPEIGGDTCFSSMTTAYDFLSTKTQDFIRGLEAVHDFASYKYLFPDTEKGRQLLQRKELEYPPIAHPVVRIHPSTQKKTLFVNPHYTRYIKNMDQRDSDALLAQLFNATSVLEYQYRHQWKPKMLVMWDNRSVQHAAVHDYYPHHRYMERITVGGDKPISETEPTTVEQLRKFKVPTYDHNDSRRAKRQFEIES